MIAAAAYAARGWSPVFQWLAPGCRPARARLTPTAKCGRRFAAYWNPGLVPGELRNGDYPVPQSTSAKDRLTWRKTSPPHTKVTRAMP